MSTKNVREFIVAWEDAQCENDRKELAEDIWYDWFCSDKSLYSRTKKIIRPLKELLIRSKKVGELELSGKNCCPLAGDLYDCFRFFDENDHFVCCVSFDSCHAGTKYSVMDKNDNHFNTNDYKAMVKKLAELLDA